VREQHGGFILQFGASWRIVQVIEKRQVENRLHRRNCLATGFIQMRT
jgi:hypothetical protein